MLKAFLTLFAGIVMVIPICGQHCPFDNTGLIVLEVIDIKTKKKIKDVTPFVIVSNSLAKTYRFESDTLDFRLNPEKTDEKWFVGFNFQSVYYEFAQDNYILALPIEEEFTDSQLPIYIKRKSGEIVKTNYTLQPEDFFDLHENFGNVWGQFEKSISPQPRTEFKHLKSLEVSF